MRSEINAKVLRTVQDNSNKTPELQQLPGHYRSTQTNNKSFWIPRIMDDNHPLARRYSFDDNGGGYQGL
jgi:hypothetical protein